MFFYLHYLINQKKFKENKEKTEEVPQLENQKELIQGKKGINQRLPIITNKKEFNFNKVFDEDFQRIEENFGKFDELAKIILSLLKLLNDLISSGYDTSNLDTEYQFPCFNKNFEKLKEKEKEITSIKDN